MLLALALSLTASLFGIQTPATPAPAAQQESEDAYAILARLIERTNALQSFVAEYRMVLEDGPERLRLVYLAPGMGWLQFERDGAIVPFCSISDGVISAMTEHDGQCGVGIADLSEMMTCIAQAEGQLRSTLGLSRAKSYRDSGVSFMLHAKEEAGYPRGSLAFGLTYSPHNNVVLGWLEDLRGVPGLRIEGDRLRLDRPDGVVVEISTCTGFVERIAKADDEERGIFLENLREDVELGAIDMVAPEAEAADPQTTARILAAMRLEGSWMARSRMYGLLAGFVEQRSGALDSNVREAAGSAFRAVHACVLPGPLESWLERTRSSAGELAENIRSSRGHLSRDDLEARADRWEENLRQHLVEARSSFLRCIDVPQAGGDAALLAELLELDHQAGAEAFDERVSAPLLRYVDELVEEALDG